MRMTVGRRLAFSRLDVNAEPDLPRLIISSECIALACTAARQHLVAPRGAARQHVNATPATPRPIHFLHLHKAGGTALCAHATASLKGRHAVPRLGEANCNLMPGDGPHTLGAGCFGFGNAQLSCASRALLAARLGVRFFATERWIDDEPEGECSTHLQRVTILREPLRRLRSSQCVHEQPELKLLGWALVRGGGGERWEAPQGFRVFADGNASRWPAPAGAPTMEGHGAASNHLTRLLLGRDEYFRAVLRVGDVRRAARALERFEAVAVLERPCTLQAMSRRLGWNAWPEGSVESVRAQAVRADQSGGGRQACPSSTRVAGLPAWSDGAEGVLCAANALDVALYAAYMGGAGLGECDGGGAAGLPPRDTCSAAAGREWLSSCAARCPGVTELDAACRALLRDRCGESVAAAVEEDLAPAPTFAVLVTSSARPLDVARRAAVRSSWFDTFVANSAADGRATAIGRFVIGGAALSTSSASSGLSKQQQQAELRQIVASRKKLALEMRAHHDVWLVAAADSHDAADSYDARSLKVRAAWKAVAAQLRPTYVIKAEPDVWVRWPQLEARLLRMRPERLYAGKVMRRMQPIRQAGHRDAEAHGPIHANMPYCSGMLYALSADLARLLAHSPLPPRLMNDEDDVGTGAMLLPHNVTPVNLFGAEEVVTYSDFHAVPASATSTQREVTGQGTKRSESTRLEFATSGRPECRDGVNVAQYVAACCMGDLGHNASAGLPVCRIQGCEGCAPTRAPRRLLGLGRVSVE